MSIARLGGSPMPGLNLQNNQHPDKPDWQKRLEELRHHSGHSFASKVQEHWLFASREEQYQIWTSLNSFEQRDLFLSLSIKVKQYLLDLITAQDKLTLLKSLSYSEYLSCPFVINNPLEIVPNLIIQDKWKAIDDPDKYSVWLYLTPTEQKSVFLAVPDEEKEAILEALSSAERFELLNTMSYAEYLQFPFTI